MPSLIKDKSLEVIKAILPLVVVIAVFQFTPLHMPADSFHRFLGSVAMVIGGMILFLVGIEVGLLPVGKAVGSELPKRGLSSWSSALLSWWASPPQWPNPT